jgi:hypothetical protein
MAYHVEIDETLVLAYLGHTDRGLTEGDLDLLLDFLEGLAHTGDGYRNDPAFRCSPGSQNLQIDFVFADATGRVRVFRFIVSDAAAAHGILRVRFAEEL